MPADPPPRNKDHIAGLAKGLRLIEAFDSAHTRMTITEAARRIEVSLAAARRCLLTLCELGYMQTDGKHFWLGHGTLRISYAYAASTRLPRLLQPALDALSERSRDSASLAVLHDAAATIAARSTARRTMRVGLGIGSRLPLHCSAAGRVLLAGLPPAQAHELLAGMEREAFTQGTVTELRALRELLQESRERGWAACDEEIELGVRSIAVPIVDAAGVTVAALSMSTRAERMTLGDMAREYLPYLVKTQQWAQARVG